MKRVIEMNTKENPMGTQPLSKLLLSLAVPAVIANLVNSLYNIVDQIFIGHGVGYLGNGATSVAFPLTTVCMAFGLMCGLGGSANFNIALGRKEPDRARKIAGTAVSMVLTFGVIICIITNLFLEPLLLLFGATESNLDLAMAYTRITSFGIPFLMFSTGTNPLVRADGSSTYSMAAIISGAILNTILDPIFIFRFHWGIAGAAWATLISQILSAVILVMYFKRFKSVRFSKKDFVPDIETVSCIVSVGISSFIFQSSTMVIQIVTNNMLRNYGEISVYGSDVSIAVAGIVTKINMIFISVIIGIVQGAQPIIGYNYGAKKYDRVKGIVRLMLTCAFVVSLAAFAVFECFPRQLMELFGEGSELYFSFGIKYIRVFLMFTILNGIQIASTTFFQAIGKAKKGAFLSLTKQVIFLLPLLAVLPRFMGVEGVMFAAPISDFIAFATAVTLLSLELKHMPGTAEQEGFL